MCRLARLYLHAYLPHLKLMDWLKLVLHPCTAEMCRHCKASAAACMQAYAEAGVKQMYPWQAAALQCGYTGSNLVYVAPTSGGKSLVSEVLLIRRLIASQHYHPVRKHIKVL